MLHLGNLYVRIIYLILYGNTREIVFDEYDEKDTEVLYGGNIAEWIDIVVEDDMKLFLREFAKAKEPKVRFSGKYTKTRILTDKEKLGILSILNGYDALTLDSLPNTYMELGQYKIIKYDKTMGFNFRSLNGSDTKLDEGDIVELTKREVYEKKYIKSVEGLEYLIIPFENFFRNRCYINYKDLEARLDCGYLDKI